jgi:exosome complex RNA-binding protein Rrp42 (RNase PH superfamily)
MTDSDAALKAAIFQRVHPRVYFSAFVTEQARPDGRAFDAWRDVSVNVGGHHFDLSISSRKQSMQARYQQQMDLPWSVLGRQR